MDFKEKFKSFFLNNNTQNHINSLKSIPIPNDYPSLNYIGVNFEKEFSSIKLYFTFFHKLDLKTVEDILPSTNEFGKYYEFWQKSKTITQQHTGCAFSLKANANMEFTKGFHLRYKLDQRSETLFEPPKFIKLTDIDLNNFPGINFEYKNGKCKKKNYYYITDKITKQQIAEQWNNESIVDANLIEYTESGDSRKIILWDNEVTGIKKTQIQFSEEHLAFNNWMEKEFQLKNYYDGVYFDNNQKASYFPYLEKKKTVPFDFTIDRHVDTAGYTLNKLKISELKK